MWTLSLFFVSCLVMSKICLLYCFFWLLLHLGLEELSITLRSSKLYLQVLSSVLLSSHSGCFSPFMSSYLCHISPDTSLHSHTWEFLLEFLIIDIWLLERALGYLQVCRFHSSHGESCLSCMALTLGANPQEKSVICTTLSLIWELGVL